MFCQKIQRYAAIGVPLSHKFFNVFSDQVILDIHLIARALAGKGCFLKRMRNDHDAEIAPRDRIDREADAIDGNRALFDNIFKQLFGGAEHQPDEFARFFPAAEDAETVNMARYQMPAEPVAQPQRPFEIYPVTCAFLAERAALQAFGRYVDTETLRLNIGDREACAIYGYAVTELYLRRGQAAPDKKFHAATAGSNSLYVANIFDKTGKHFFAAFLCCEKDLKE